MSTKKFRNVVWFDLVDRGKAAVIEAGAVEASDAFSAGLGQVNVVYDEETDTAYTLTADPWPPTVAVRDTLEQYEPGEL